MKIDNSLKTVGGIATEGSPGKSARSESTPSPPGVSVELSKLSSQLQAVGSSVSGGEVADAARIAKIRQAISEGRFKVNPDVVADRLLQTVRDLMIAHKQ